MLEPRVLQPDSVSLSKKFARSAKWMCLLALIFCVFQIAFGQVAMGQDEDSGADSDLPPRPTHTRKRRRTPKAQYRYLGNYDLEAGVHTTSPSTMSNERIGLFFAQKAKFSSKWSALGSAQGWYEVAYANDTYAPPLGEDAYDVRLQDTYVQYQEGSLLARAGYQQVVWGETFGSFVADIVNPKDLRYGVPMDLAKLHMATPIINAKYIAGQFSLQGLLILQPEFNLLPAFGTDYSPANNPLNGFASAVINRERSMPFGNLEYGARASESFDGIDLSFFDLLYYDRNPYYLVDHPYVPGTTFTLDEHHSQINSAGQAIAWALQDSGIVFREEAVYSSNRDISILKPNAILSQLLTSELAAAASVELPTYGRFNLSFQWSVSHLGDPGNYITRSAQDFQHITQRTSMHIFESSTLDSILTWSLLDAGIRWQIDLMNPLTAKLEAHTGTEIYTGNGQSDYGSIQRASRVYFSIKGYFNH